MKVFVPPIKIQGIKTKIVPLIKQSVFLNEKSVWYEPFMGSGVVGFNVAPKKAIFADKNPYLIDFYNEMKEGKIDEIVVRDFLEKEGRLLELGDDAHYYLVRKRFNENHNPLDFLFLNRSCFNGMIRFNKDYHFNVPYGHKPKRFAKAYVTKIVNQVGYLSKMIRHNSWEFLCQDFRETIGLAEKGDFIYCDPPYIGRHVDYYDSWDEESEIDLYNALVSSKARFMLSTWDCNRYRKNEYLEKVWNNCQKITKEHFYFVGAKESNRNAVMEALLTNYTVTDNQNRISDEQIALI